MELTKEMLSNVPTFQEWWFAFCEEKAEREKAQAEREAAYAKERAAEKAAQIEREAAYAREKA
jgi:hypothetical protein